MVIKRVNPVSVAKIAGVVYAGIGLIIGGIFSLIAMAGGLAADQAGMGALGMAFGAAAIIVAPIIYGILGFIGMLICAVIFNAATGIVGGVEIDVQ